MKRTIIKIDEDMCNGCGLCIEGCHEGALQLIDGKARMISDLYCDGLGACIPECPVQAITLEEREAEPYDEVKVMERIAPKGEATVIAHLNHLIDHDQMEFVRQGIQYINDNNLTVDLTKLKPMKSKKTPKGERAPAMAAGGQAGGQAGESQAPSAGRHSHPLHGRTHDKAHGVEHGNMQGHTHGHAHGRTHGHGHGNMRGHGQAHGHGHSGGCPGSKMMSFEPALDERADGQQVADQPSALRQWPVQLHLVNPQAPYFQDADVLLAADCVAFSMGNFHSKYLKGKGLAIACPKLDSGKDIYVEKLTAMIDHANINTLTVMMMEVPCCSGILQMTKMAVQNASRKVPVKALVVGLDGQIRKEQWT